MQFEDALERIATSGIQGVRIEAVLGALLFFVNFELIDLDTVRLGSGQKSDGRMYLETFCSTVSQLLPAGSYRGILLEHVLSNCLTSVSGLEPWKISQANPRRPQVLYPGFDLG